MHDSIFILFTQVVSQKKISILSQTIFQQKKKTLLFSKHINLFIKKKLEEELSTRNDFFL